MENLNLEAYIHTTIQLPYLVQQKNTKYRLHADANGNDIEIIDLWY